MLGGYSLGAAATDMVLAVPIPVLGFKTPLPSGADSHIAAVALFGNGTQWFGPISDVQPGLQGPDHRVVPRFAIRSAIRPTRRPGRDNWPDHLAAAYIDSGMVDQAADFVAGRL